MYAEYLSYRGLTPLCVQQAHDAIRLASRADVVVTGLLLPGPLDGYGLIESLRRDPDTRMTPIVVLTVCAWIEEEARARRAGCDVFLSKPCFPHKLFREVRRLLALRSHGSARATRERRRHSILQ